MGSLNKVSPPPVEEQVSPNDELPTTLATSPFWNKPPPMVSETASPDSEEASLARIRSVAVAVALAPPKRVLLDTIPTKKRKKMGRKQKGKRGKKTRKPKFKNGKSRSLKNVKRRSPFMNRRQKLFDVSKSTGKIRTRNY